MSYATATLDKFLAKKINDLAENNKARNELGGEAVS